jgi:hypothetical protein
MVTAPVLLKWRADGASWRTKRSERPRKIDRAFLCLKTASVNSRKAKKSRGGNVPMLTEAKV